MFPCRRLRPTVVTVPAAPTVRPLSSHPHPLPPGRTLDLFRRGRKIWRRRIRLCLRNPVQLVVATSAERLRTDDDSSAGIDREERHLLETIEGDFLDLFADEYCNKHLVWSIIETVLAKVLPEMAERSVEDLLEDRGVASVPPAFV
mgnify:CR=1 FL=1